MRGEIPPQLLSTINAQLPTPTTATTLGVVDYGSGNLRSVTRALDAVGARTVLITRPEDLGAIDAIVVPGVGAFGDCARNLRATGLWEPIREWLAAGRPYLGICLGYQLLFESSEETPGVAGLGALPGVVRRFPAGALKVPHMGWNTLAIRPSGAALYRELPPEPSVYFVHSYYPVPADDTLVTATCDYAGGFAASVGRGTLQAVQFHPEKSQRNGLAILQNFVATVEQLQNPNSQNPDAPVSRH